MADFQNINVQTKIAVGKNKRIGQRDILPGTVKGRALSDFIVTSPLASATFTNVDNGDDGLLSAELSHVLDYPIQGVPYIGLYVGSVSDANQLPGGSGIDESQWQIIGPFYNLEDWDDDGNVLNKERISIYVRNISAGTVTLIFQVKYKTISPRDVT